MGVAIKVSKASGTKVYMDGALRGENEINLISTEIPYMFVDGCVVLYKGEIHILGSSITANNRNLYICISYYPSITYIDNQPTEHLS